MSTPCLVGLLLPDSQVRYIYTHSSGEPVNAGAVLQEHYSSTDRVHDLLNLGDLSLIRPKIGHKTDFDNPAKGQCLAYIRDRGEPLERCAAKTSSHRERYFALLYQDQIPYAYLWTGDSWRTATNRDWNTRLETLHPNPAPYLDSSSPWQPLDLIITLSKGETPSAHLPDGDPPVEQTHQRRLF